MYNDSQIIKKEFLAPTPGVNLLLFGAIHGDEVCGSEAIRRIVARLENGNLVLTRGSLTCVPVCNPRAYERQVRFTEENLNRIFRRLESPISYEAHLANELCSLVERADFLLDIHSFATPGPTTVFIDYPTQTNRALAKTLGAEYSLQGWPSLYEGSTFTSYDTTRHASEVGRDGLLVECGQHADPVSIDRGEEFILRTLEFFQMVKKRDTAHVAEFPMHTVNMTRIFGKEAEGDLFTKPWRHFDRISAGTVVAQRASGADIVADKDMVILFPKHYAKAGEEWFYLGEFI